MKKKSIVFLSLLSLSALATLASCVGEGSDKATSSSEVTPSTTVPSTVTTTTPSTTTPSDTTTSTSTTTSTESEYIFKEFKWADDFSSASLVLKNDLNDEKEISATVSIKETEATCESKGKIEYTATATYKGVEYTETKEKETSAIGHDWNNPTYVWSNDYSTCTATRVCKNNPTHIETETKSSQYVKTSDATCDDNEKGKYVVSFDNDAFVTQETNDIEKTNTKLGHYWDTPTYTWNSDKTKCTARSVCKNNPQHVLEEIVDSIYQVVNQPKCEENGLGRYTASFTNSLFETQTEDVVINAIGHDWNNPTYVWSNDYSTCTATRVCKNDSTHIETETKSSQYVKTSDATCDDNEKGKYVVSFDNDAFVTQETNDIEKTNTKLGHDWDTPIYTWNSDKTKCTARCVCKNNSQHVLEEIANSSYQIVNQPKCEENGLGRYTASFTNSLFETQTEDVVINAIGHDWNNPTYVWSNDYSTCTATRVCKNDPTHIETEIKASQYVKTSDATCGANEFGKYVVTFTNTAFTNQETSSIEKTNTKLSHVWGTPTYTWNNDNTKCTAKVVCVNDSSHYYEQTVDTSYVEIIPATCLTQGTGKYTATFTNSLFTNQEKNVSIPAKGHKYGTPTYEWADDFSKVTGRVVCVNDSSHVLEETVNASGSITYATKDTVGKLIYESGSFTNSQFKKQSENIDLYYVEFVDKDGNTISAENIHNDIKAGSKVTYSGNNPTVNTGSNTLTYVFLGWSVNNTLINLSNYTINQNTTFKATYAKYELKKNIDCPCTVTGLSSDNIAKGTSKTISATTKNGYVFLGWYSIINNVETALSTPTSQYQRNALNYTFNSSVDVVLEARWMEMPFDISVNNSSAGSVNIPSTSWLNKVETISVNTNDGYAFKGFYDTNDNLVYSTNNIPDTSFDVTMLNDMNVITLTAKFEVLNISVGVNNSNMGSVTGFSGSKVVGETRQLVATPVTGYSFEGWYKDGNPYSTDTTIELVINSTSDGYYEARFKSYTVTTKINDSDAGVLVTNYTNKEMEAGKSVTVKVTPKKGYTFVGWYKNDDLTAPISMLEEYTFTMGKEDITLEARFECYKVTTVNLNPDYGTITEYNEEKIVKDSIVTLEATPKKGYTFKGWYEKDADINNDLPVSTSTEFSFTMQAHDYYYKAVFVYYTITITTDETKGDVLGDSDSNTVTVSFNLKGGTGDIKSQVVSNETSISYPGEVLKDGYVFNGWYIDSACTERFDFTSTLNKDMTLYAGYTQITDTGYKTKEVVDFARVYNNQTNSYQFALDGTQDDSTYNIYFTCYQTGTLTFYVNNNKSATDSSNHIIVYKVNDTSVPEYNHIVSSKNYASFNYSVNEGDVICIKNYIISDTATDVLASIYIEGNDIPESTGKCGSIKYSNTKITAGDEVTLYAVPKEGYTFVKWNKNGEEYSTNPTVTFDKATTNESYEAVFTSYTFTLNVVYGNDDSNAGSIVNEYNNTKITAGSSVELKVLLTKGYTFLGYYNGSTFISNKLEYSFNMPKNNLTYEARFTYYEITITLDNPNAGTAGGISENNYSIVTFNTNGANETYDDQIVTPSNKLVYPGNPTKDGYVFTGWYSNSSCTELFDFDAVLSDNKTLYAGFYEINVSPANSVDITTTANSTSNRNTINVNSSDSYSFFSIPVDGTYKFYYKVANSSTDSRVYINLRNITKSLNIIDNNAFTDSNYVSISFEANRGDVLRVDTKTYISAVNGFDYYLKKVENSNDVTPYNPISNVVCGAMNYSNTKIEGGTHITLQATVNTGYEFVGWKSIKTGEILTTNLTCEIIVGEDSNGTYQACYKLI